MNLKGTVLSEIKIHKHQLTDTENRLVIAKSRRGECEKKGGQKVQASSYKFWECNVCYDVYSEQYCVAHLRLDKRVDLNLATRKISCNYVR